MAGIDEITPDKTVRDFRPSLQVELITLCSFQTVRQGVVNEDAIGIAAFTAHVIDCIAITCKSAVPHHRPRALENRQGSTICERLLARMLRNHIFARIGDVTDEQTINNSRSAPFQKINRGSSDLRSIP